MAVKSIRLGSTLTFDSEKEKDLIAIAERLNQMHKMGEFMSHIFRVAVENPNMIETAGGIVKYGSIIERNSRMGITAERYNYFSEINNEIKEMQRKVDEIYNMSLRMYSLARVGKRIGLEEKAVNSLSASFMVEKQVKELSRIVGTNLILFESDKVLEVKEKAEEIMEYIIESYDGMIGEMQEALGNKEEAHRVDSGELEHYKEELTRARNEANYLKVQLGYLEEDNRSTRGQLNEKVTAYEKMLSEKDAEIKLLREENERLRSTKIEQVSSASSTSSIATKESKQETVTKEYEEEEVLDFGSVADFSALSNFFG